jgi:outer membrane lipoprotein-sorting protein
MFLKPLLMTLVFAATPGLAKVSKSAKASKKATPLQEVTKVLTAYRAAPAIQAKVKKTVTQEALGTEMKSEGIFYFSKGKLRLEIREPEKSTLVYDGKVVWFETPIDDTQVHVTKIRTTGLRKSDSLLASLLDRKDSLNSFKLINKKSNDGRNSYFFEPKDKKKSEVQKLEISIRQKDLDRIVYSDQVENRISLEFSDVNKKSKVAKDKFAYKPPKKAEVTEF